MNNEETKMLSYHNDQKLKDKYVKQVQAHIDIGELVHNKGWSVQTFNGNEKIKCGAIGCVIHENIRHHVYADKLGIPVWLVNLKETLFNHVNPEQSLTKQWNQKVSPDDFPLRFLKAMPVGVSDAEFNKIKIQYTLFILKENMKYMEKLNVNEKNAFLEKKILDINKRTVMLRQSIPPSDTVVDSIPNVNREAWEMQYKVRESGAPERIVSIIKTIAFITEHYYYAIAKATHTALTRDDCSLSLRKTYAEKLLELLQNFNEAQDLIKTAKKHNIEEIARMDHQTSLNLKSKS